MSSPPMYGPQQQPHAGAHYSQGHQPGAPPVAAVQPVLGRMPPDPIQTSCPNCREAVVTVTEPAMGILTWLLVGGTIFFGCCLCSYIPCFINDVKDIVHRCPRCSFVIGRHERLK